MALPHPLPATAVPNARDLTGSVQLDPLHYSFDPRTNRASITFVIINRSKHVIAPSLLVGVVPHSDFGVARMLNPARKIGGQPAWNVPSAGREIPPGDSSPAMTIRAAIDHFHAAPANYLEGDAFAMAVRVYGTR